MTNSTATKTILSTLAATLVATTLSVSTAAAGGGGGDGYDGYSSDSARKHRHKPGKTFVTLHNKDGSSKTVRKGCCGTRFKEKRNKKGKLTSRRNYRPDRSSWASTRDPRTGKTFISGRTEGGKRFRFTVSPFGFVSIGIHR